MVEDQKLHCTFLRDAVTQIITPVEESETVTIDLVCHPLPGIENNYRQKNDEVRFGNAFSKCVFAMRFHVAFFELL
jgi:hypothetical protein